ncbi:MAG: hypothetical protein AAGA48_41170, partial [Myxococcota bacterium]
MWWLVSCWLSGSDEPDFVQRPVFTVELPPPVCNRVERNGNLYNCDTLDRCNETNFEYRLACCDCDPILCEPDPRCEP